MPVKMYRVAVFVDSHAPRDPEGKRQASFIDFAPAQIGSNTQMTHAMMMAIRQKNRPELECVTDGLLLKDFGDGHYVLQPEMVTNKQIRDYQNSIINQFQKPIFEAFRQMRNRGAETTMTEDPSALTEIMPDAFLKNPNENLSSRGLANRDKASYYDDLEKRRKDLLSYSQTRKRHSYGKD